MRRRLALALLLALASVQAPLRAQRPDQACADKPPKECANVKFLGESDGCACFVCNPDTPQRKVVCTKDAADKRALYKLRDDALRSPPAKKPSTGGKP